jgi:hypothetical protein
MWENKIICHVKKGKWGVGVSSSRILLQEIKTLLFYCTKMAMEKQTDTCRYGRMGERTG